MPFEYLDRESEKLLKELNDNNDILDIIIVGTTILYLIKNEYIRGSQFVIFNEKGIKDKYCLKSISHKGKTYFEMKEKYEKESKKI